MNKKWLILFLVVTVIICAFSSCTSGNNGDATSSSNPAPNPAESTSEESTSTPETDPVESTSEESTSTPETDPVESTSEESTSTPETEPVDSDSIKLVVDEFVMVIDDETTNAGQPIQYVAGYGVGYSSMGDIVYFEDVDFGEKGAVDMTIHFANGNSMANTTLAVYLDDYENTEPICTFDIGFTGGWTLQQTKPFTADCAIPGGLHTIYIKFTNSTSGSFGEVFFTKAS